jgi:hypothetical protein
MGREGVGGDGGTAGRRDGRVEKKGVWGIEGEREEKRRGEG